MGLEVPSLAGKEKTQVVKGALGGTFTAGAGDKGKPDSASGVHVVHQETRTVIFPELN